MLTPAGGHNPSRFRWALVAAVVVHGAAFGAFSWWGPGKPVRRLVAPEVVFYAEPAPKARVVATVELVPRAPVVEPQPVPTRPLPKKRPVKPTPVKVVTATVGRDVADAGVDPVDAGPAGDVAGDAGTPGDVGSGAVADGAPGGSGDGEEALDGPLTTGVRQFEAGMTRPVLDPNNAPVRFTAEARAARVQGLMVLRCVISLDGRLESCRVVQGLPYMNETVLETVSTWRVTPVRYQGQVVTVEYEIPLRLVAPR